MTYQSLFFFFIPRLTFFSIIFKMANIFIKRESCYIVSNSGCGLSEGDNGGAGPQRSRSLANFAPSPLIGQPYLPLLDPDCTFRPSFLLTRPPNEEQRCFLQADSAFVYWRLAGVHKRSSQALH